MTAAELEQALGKCADERDTYQALILDLLHQPFDRPDFGWRDARRAAIESHWDAFVRGNALLASFLGARVVDMSGPWWKSDLIDHPCSMYVGRNLLGYVSHSYNSGDILRHEAGGLLARRLAVRSWWHRDARVFVLMAPDAPQWERLEPLLVDWDVES